MTYNGGASSALYEINDDWNVLITESLENLEADGLSVEYPDGSDFQTLKPLQVTSFSPSYDKDRYSNTAWTVNGKIADLKLVYTGGYTDRDITSRWTTPTIPARAAACITSAPAVRPASAPARRSCYSPARLLAGHVHSTHLSNEFRVSTPDDWRIRAIAGAYREEFRIYDDMNFNYKTIPACTPANLPPRWPAGRSASPMCAPRRARPPTFRASAATPPPSAKTRSAATTRTPSSPRSISTSSPTC